MLHDVTCIQLCSVKEGDVIFLVIKPKKLPTTLDTTQTENDKWKLISHKSLRMSVYQKYSIKVKIK